MKLSEAIRLGEFALPAKYNTWLAIDQNGQPCGGCVVGRTAYATGFNCRNAKGHLEEDATILSEFFNKTWPWTVGFVPPLPPNVSQTKYRSRIKRSIEKSRNLVMSTMSWAYERERLSLVQIADYIESFEPQKEPTVAKEVQEVQHAR